MEKFLSLRVSFFPPIPQVLFPLHPPSSYALPFSETPECGAYQYQRSGRCCQKYFFLSRSTPQDAVVGT
jgi:hypothetical protein